MLASLCTTPSMPPYVQHPACLPMYNPQYTLRHTLRYTLRHTLRYLQTSLGKKEKPTLGEGETHLREREPLRREPPILP